MEKLTLAHLAPYLPYGLTFLSGKDVFTMHGLKQFDGQIIVSVEGKSNPDYTIYPAFDGAKPILRPLSDLPTNRFTEFGYAEFERFRYDVETGFVSLKLYWWLIRNHFDYYDLIKKGLAISIHDIKQ